MKVLAKLVLKLFGWKLLGGIPPELKKYVIAVAPHTSWTDFFLGLTIRAALGRKIYYLGKKELFDSPIGFFFWWTGGRPVDRNQKTGLVDQVVHLFNGSPEFAIALAPEGTRKKVQNFKTGFYFIARKAGVPVIPCLFDYENKEVSFLTPFYPTKGAEKDLDSLWSLYDGVKGAKPEWSISGERISGSNK
ncbi:MAG: 1-acyl-sn-glycerol-3-phosphate acyltransferase [Bacteroidota bacterium]|nr:1-acyl-sn-glycerol-3-phosphate acyltransferase [Bacteroidota bacterium]